MSKIGLWSTTAANNNSTPPDGWPEGQAPSTVNDCAREMMAQVKTLVNNLEYIDFANTPSFLTTTTFSMATADVANFEIGRRLKLFDTTTLYGTIISVSSTFVQVQLDSGALTTSLSSVALSVIKNTNNSLPVAAFRNRNYIVNPQFEVWQRGSAFTTLTNRTYMADQWLFEIASTAVVNASRLQRAVAASNCPTLAQVGYVVNSSLGFSVSTGDAAVASTDLAMFSQIIEGNDWRPFAHKPFTVDFWVNSSVAGTYGLAVRSTNASASYVQNYTISAVNTWTHFTLPVPAAPTTPYTWDYSSGAGISICWSLMAGTTWQATGGAWTAMNALATSSQVNFLAAAGATFAISAVSVYEGSGVRPVENRSIQEELDLCHRTYYVALGAHMGVCNGGSAADVVVNLPVPMRTDPTVLLVSPGSVIDGANSSGVSSVSIAVPHFQNPRLYVSTQGGTVAGRGALWYSSRLDFDAGL